MGMSERLTDKIKENKLLTEKLKLRDNKIKEQGDKISAQGNYIGELEFQLAEYDRKQREGYCWYTVDPKTLLITNMGEVLPYSNFTYVRPIPKEIDTNEYRSNPYYQLDKNGKLDINTIQAMKYKTGGLL